MKVIVVGQGKMGFQITQQLIEAGHQVVAMDPSLENRQKAELAGAQTSEARDEVVKSFQSSEQLPVVWLMIPSGAVDAELSAWLEILPENATVVDGGNSDFRLSKKRGETAQVKNINFVDVGVSGGVLGLENGFSMMVGGSQESYKAIEPILQAMAKTKGGYAYFGPEFGTGHFVKMVHNGIEYGVMESLAEGYRLLKEGPYNNLNLADAGDVWQQGSVIGSELNGLAAKAFHENPELSGVDGYVAESGEARWTLEAAKDAGIDVPAIQTALDVRLASQDGQVNFATKVLAELRKQFGGHAINKDK